MEPIDQLRNICLEFPDVTERLSHGEPTWFIRQKKSFVMSVDHHHDNRVGFWCAYDGLERDSLVAERPEAFYRPPYVGVRGWLGVFLDVPVDWDEIAEIAETAYRRIAPQKLVALLEAHVAAELAEHRTTAKGSSLRLR
jgi:hypothetical protein